MENFLNIYSKENIEFVAAAKEYLVLLENSKKLNKKDFVDSSLKILTMLYLKGLSLKKANYLEDESIQKFVTETHWSYFQNIVSEILDDEDQIIQIQDINIISDSDYFNIPLSELFADIYQEMGDLIGSYRLENEEVMTAALSVCAENFYSYWGIRVLELVKYLHIIKSKFSSDDL